MDMFLAADESALATGFTTAGIGFTIAGIVMKVGGCNCLVALPCGCCCGGGGGGGGGCCCNGGDCGGIFSLKLFNAVLLFRTVLFVPVVMLLLLLLLMLLLVANNESGIGLHRVFPGDKMFFIVVLLSLAVVVLPTNGLDDLMITGGLPDAPTDELANITLALDALALDALPLD
jgi:hypothetical protein